jgi:hypothetical protein
MKNKSFRELVNESIKVTNNSASKYFKMIQKATNAKMYNITDAKGINGYTVDFSGGKEDFSLLVDTTKGKDGWIVGYRFGTDNLNFRQLPANFTSVKDIVNDYKILKMAKGKSFPAKTVIKKAETQIKLSEPDNENDFDFENDKYGAIKEGKLYRIYAKKSFGNVKEGDKGGFIEKESNLSETGNAWVYGNAKVYGKAKVYDNACAFDNADISGNARVYGDLVVYSVFSSNK